MIKDGLRLKRCDIKTCEGMCCYDGVYLTNEEEHDLLKLVEQHPEILQKLPVEFIVDGYWQGRYLGRKTAIRPYQYQNENFPAHFTKTKCVFSDSNGFCELEKLGGASGVHPWKYKPSACWLFPLSLKDGEPAAPPSSPMDDPYRADDYPGYVTAVPCGQQDPDGMPWEEALSREIRYFKEKQKPGDVAI